MLFSTEGGPPQEDCVVCSPSISVQAQVTHGCFKKKKSFLKTETPCCNGKMGISRAGCKTLFVLLGQEVNFETAFLQSSKALARLLQASSRLPWEIKHPQALC